MHSDIINVKMCPRTIPPDRRLPMREKGPLRHSPPQSHDLRRCSLHNRSATDRPLPSKWCPILKPCGHTGLQDCPFKNLLKAALLTKWALDLYSRDGSCRETRIRTRARRLETGTWTRTRLLATQLWPLGGEYGQISYGHQNVRPLLLLCLWVFFTVWLIALRLRRVGLWTKHASRRQSYGEPANL